MKTTKKRNQAIILILLIILATGSTQAQDAQDAEDAKEIIRRMEENMYGDASYSEMSMQMVRPRYTREVTMSSWTLGDDYSLIYITAPARDEGTAFLKRGNEIWNYQPNIDRTIKMPPSMLSQSWMGSDFTNDDLVNASSLINDFSHELTGTESIDEQECYVIEMKPNPDNTIVYDKVIYWVSKEYYLPVRTENYDDYDNLVSTVHFREIKNLGDRYIPTIMEMIPADRDNQKTVITTHSSKFDIDMTQEFFSTRNLTNIRP
jgi:outer membrane lipoprotein-sorting protein